MLKKDKKNWRVYIVAHDRIYDEMYEGDNGFNNDNYVFLNVGNKETLGNSEKYRVINQKDLDNYVSLGIWWAESEGIYNIWRSGIYKELDFIGFSQYDKEHRLRDKKFPAYRNTNITEQIDKYLRGKQKAHISLETYGTKWAYDQWTLADESQPEKVEDLSGNGVNCYEYIANDYNAFFGTNITVEDFLRRKYINLCSSFVIDVPSFEKMLGFWDHIVQSGKLMQFDKAHKYRMQGSLAERYFGFFLTLEYEKIKDLSIIHYGRKGLLERVGKSN